MERAAGTDHLASVGRPRLFRTPYATAQPRFFGLDVLGEAGSLKATRLEDYAPRRPSRPRALQEALFSYLNAL